MAVRRDSGELRKCRTEVGLSKGFTIKKFRLPANGVFRRHPNIRPASPTITDDTSRQNAVMGSRGPVADPHSAGKPISYTTDRVMTQGGDFGLRLPRRLRIALDGGASGATK